MEAISNRSALNGSRPSPNSLITGLPPSLHLILNVIVDVLCRYGERITRPIQIGGEEVTITYPEKKKKEEKLVREEDKEKKSEKKKSKKSKKEKKDDKESSSSSSS